MITQLTTREVYRNNWMSVREDTVGRPDGSNGIFGVVDKTLCAVIIAMEENRIHLVEQFRYPVNHRAWEFPMGAAPDHTTLPPLGLATRELHEETGLRADSWVEIGRFNIAPGWCSQHCYAYLATGLTQSDHAREYEEQDMRSAWFERDEVEKMITAGQINDAPSLAAFSLLLLHERR